MEEPSCQVKTNLIAKVSTKGTNQEETDSFQFVSFFKMNWRKWIFLIVDCKIFIFPLTVKTIKNLTMQSTTIEETNRV